MTKDFKRLIDEFEDETQIKEFTDYSRRLINAETVRLRIINEKIEKNAHNDMVKKVLLEEKAVIEEIITKTKTTVDNIVNRHIKARGLK